MADYVWLIHPDLPKVNNPLDAYGADIADMFLDLGLSGNFNRPEAFDAFYAWLPITLDPDEIAALEPTYTLSASSRHVSNVAEEWIIHPDSMTGTEAEAYISPNKPG